MKRIIIFVCICVLIFSSCCYDPYSGKRPQDYPNTTWVSESPNISFVISPEYEVFPHKGELIIDDVVYICAVQFEAGTSCTWIRFFDPDDIEKQAQMGNEWGEYEFEEAEFSFRLGSIWGESVFSEYEFTINIDDDSFFNGQYDSITFTRYDN